ncbi:MAG: prepilin-type N-terminal cleavage/methylation domain-containing protein [Lachnospiraceae bacterium]|nr:prepilin-type N-terminal cleavage/methylation domain-containing protein [Lachnospiraceae bacterium]
MEKSNDKGFSLIELIIVVAIMAALIMIIAPQYFKYVEKSRNATDLQNARAVVTAIETYAVDPNSGFPPPDYWQAVTAFAVDDTADRPDNMHGGSYGGALNGDTRVDDYAWYAMQEAGLIQPSGRPVGIRAQSRYSWETWTVEYKSDGKGGIMFRFGEKAGEPVAGDKFREAMTGK